MTARLVNLTPLTDYELRNVVAHLVALGRHPVAAAVLTRLDVLVDHAVRAGVDSLIGDFAVVADADGSLSPTAGALRDAAAIYFDDGDITAIA